MDNREFDGFAGHTSEQPKNLTEEQASQTLHDHPEFFNPLIAYLNKEISAEQYLQIVKDTVNESENK